MKTFQITHNRCNEYAGTTFGFVPDDMTQEEFLRIVGEAQREYLEFLERYERERKAADERIDYRLRPDLSEADPDKTVRELLAEQAEKKLAYDAWQKTQSEAYRTFGNYLEPHGIVLWHDVTPDLEADVDWGHRHGMTIGMDDEYPSERDIPGPRLRQRL